MRAPNNEPGPDLTGQLLGDQFRLLAQLGGGGMGEVYLAEQLEVGRRVVIKMLSGKRPADEHTEERFRREARALAQLNHPNVVHLYMFGRGADGRAYLAMEYIDGRTLTSLVDEAGALPELQVLNILDQLCSALLEAHERGIIHRDLKPDNVMLVEHPDQPPLVKVLDFGIAKLTRDPELRLTQPGAFIGTPLYMAPEQLHDGVVDPRTDIYALGMIGYELLTGQVPFDADSTMQLLARIATEPVPAPSQRAPGVQLSAHAEALIMRCLAKQPDDRYQTANALRDALAEIPRDRDPQSPRRETLRLSFEGPAPDWDPPRHTGMRRAPKRRLGAALTMFGLGVLTAAVVWLAVARPHWLRWSTPPQYAAGNSSGLPGSLPLREWVQGIPFPEGTDYAKFDPQFIDARVPAEPELVLAFYRYHLAGKWNGFEAQATGLAFADRSAPIESLTVTPFRRGSRITILRRQ